MQGSNIKLGAQNVHWEKEGAFTGEIAAPMLKELAVRYAIVGHSERRQYFGETNEGVNKRAKAALANGFARSSAWAKCWRNARRDRRKRLCATM